ncbi:hypothetical protein TCAL_02630 [Tigriopus californicus]|uniref:Uncharacterized protein n=1 Tax=Tigriopus californicus TaxID=6832 RepID=A0A553NFB0_TIGCA|nr:hypothetical protein TCAL_02630 [Tigriopus californicus]
MSWATELEICSIDPMTGWHRGGYCRTDDNDFGISYHVFSNEQAEFLEYTKAQATICPIRHTIQLSGFKARDKWCICALRWREPSKLERPQGCIGVF